METTTDKATEAMVKSLEKEEEDKQLDQNNLEYLKRKFETFGDCA